MAKPARRGRGRILTLGVTVWSLALVAAGCGGVQDDVANGTGAERARLVDPDSSTEFQVASTPLITSASISDIRESWLNGPIGFAYFEQAPAQKTGELPSALGGESGWDLDVWASNFQGPVRVDGQGSRVQWEWTAAGETEDSGRPPYPFVFGQQATADPAELAAETYAVREHDEDGWYNPWSEDDLVGTFTIDHQRCRTEVFDRGVLRGWTQEASAEVTGAIVAVRYRLFCVRTGLNE